MVLHYQGDHKSLTSGELPLFFDAVSTNIIFSYFFINEMNSLAYFLYYI